MAGMRPESITAAVVTGHNKGGVIGSARVAVERGVEVQQYQVAEGAPRSMHCGEIGDGVLVVRCYVERLSVVLRSHVILAELAQQHAQIVVRNRQRGVLDQCTVVGSEGRLKTTALAQRQAQLVLGRARGGPQHRHTLHNQNCMLKG